MHLPGIERVLELLQPAVGGGADAIVRVVVQRGERLLHRCHRLSLHGSNDPAQPVANLGFDVREEKNLNTTIAI